MGKRRLLWMVALIAIAELLFPQPVQAYIDPGTTGNIFSFLAPFFVVVLGFLGLLIQPFRRGLASLLAKLRGNLKSKSSGVDEGIAPDETPDSTEGSDKAYEKHKH